MWKHSAEYERIEISADDCPRLTPGFLKKEKERLGDRMYRQEYMNSFVDTEDSLFRTEVISKCIHDDMESFDDFVNSMDSAFDELEGDEEDAGVSVDELGLEETPLVTPENEEIPVIARLKDGAYEAKE